VHRLQKSMQKHVKANVGFYVETVVEAIPQAVIQLIAVTALGQATTLQLLSMCLSLFSIVSKAYIVSVSFDLRAMLFKASLVAFDVFSMFYLFATVLAMDETVETTVWMLLPSGLGLGGESAVASGVMGLRWVPLQVSWLAAAWLHKNFYLMIAAVLTLIGIGVYAVYDQIWQRQHTTRLRLLHVPSARPSSQSFSSRLFLRSRASNWCCYFRWFWSSFLELTACHSTPSHSRFIVVGSRRAELKARIV
jgi:hypothetical protein